MMIKKLLIVYLIVLNTISYASMCSKNYLPMPMDTGLVVVVPFYECKSAPPSPVAIYYGDFARTIKTYRETANLNVIVRNIFGSNYRVADWKDLEKFYYDKNGNLLNLFNKLNLKKYGASAYVTWYGERVWSGRRYYYVSRHENNKPSYYLDHSDINSNLISLGSWYDLKKPIMAVKKSF